MPALLLFGARDGTVPSSDSMHRLTPLLAAQSHDKSRMYLFPEKGHSLGGTKKSEDPVYVRIVTEWIHAVLNDQPIPHVDLPAAADDPALRWYGNAAQQTPWYSTAAVQLPLILLFGFIFLAGAVASLLPQFTLAATNSSWLPKLILGLTCILNLLLLGGTGFVINYLLSADQMSAGPDIPLRIYLFIGALVSTLLAGALCYVGIAVYRRQTAHTISLVTWGFVTLTSIAFVLFLRYWGVLGMPL
ncbi:hypothetical protein KFU94_52770 [Chloroflexi bacterium TSY]|nr:hypothetical protein [Chloroflexi bacterium TSY]